VAIQITCVVLSSFKIVMKVVIAVAKVPVNVDAVNASGQD
jgi:hypothetical protein